MYRYRAVSIDIRYTKIYYNNMQYFEWDPVKNLKIKKERGVTFEDVIIALENGKILEILNHPNINKYPNQKIFVLDIRGYAYYVPYVEDRGRTFLKTIFP